VRIVAPTFGDDDIVSAVGRGQEMLSILESEPVDLLLLDLQLPGEDGLDLARQVREISRVPILILSGRSDEVDRVMGLELARLASGTRMSVYWPAVPTPDNTGSETASEDAGAGETILIVDDERDLVTLTEELLASLGYEPVGFSDARAALDAFRHNPRRFDAILTDERMQPLSGLEFAARIHEIEPRVSIILMTGHRDTSVDRRARKEGIAEILDKPLRVQTLRGVLASQLRGVLSR
jgi:DNA-binding response OmpR family regulator